MLNFEVILFDLGWVGDALFDFDAGFEFERWIFAVHVVEVLDVCVDDELLLHDF